jgi:hypothetical protein
MKNMRLIAVLALSMLFVSCDKDNELPGSEVLVRVQSLAMAEGGEEEVARSAFRKEPEVVSTSIGDGILLEMSMERHESPLRAEQPLTHGAHFRVIAVKTGTSEYVSHGNFTIGGASTDDKFLVTSYFSYDFICISYNKTTNTLPAFSPSKGTDISSEVIDSDMENLLWWKETNVPVTNADPALSILLNHLVARVKVIIDCSYNGWAIVGIEEGITLGSSTLVPSVGLVSGAVSGTAGNQAVTWLAMNVITPTQQTSNPLLLKSQTSSTFVVTVPKNVIIRASPLQPIPTTEGTYVLKGNFTTAMASGKSYAFRVKLRASKWSGSNIYWKWKDNGDRTQGGYLTFDVAEATGANRHEGYQGILFKFGSLVGISPAQPTLFSTIIPVYVPAYNAGAPLSSTWSFSFSLSPSSYTSDGWTETAAANVDDVATIPYLDGRDDFNSTDNTRNNNFVAAAAQNTQAMYERLRGDICQYLGKTGVVPDEYRLPTSSEFGTENTSGFNISTPIAGGWVAGINPWPAPDYTTGNAEGSIDLVSSNLGFATNQTMNVALPASGHRSVATVDVAAGTLVNAGQGGYYWTGSARSATSGWHLYFRTSNVSPATTANRCYAFAVRCVKK